MKHPERCPNSRSMPAAGERCNSSCRRHGTGKTIRALDNQFNILIATCSSSKPFVRAEGSRCAFGCRKSIPVSRSKSIHKRTNLTSNSCTPSLQACMYLQGSFLPHLEHADGAFCLQHCAETFHVSGFGCPPELSCAASKNPPSSAARRDSGRIFTYSHDRFIASTTPVLTQRWEVVEPAARKPNLCQGGKCVQLFSHCSR